MPFPQLLHDLRGLLLPPCCAGCGCPGEWWCADCRARAEGGPWHASAGDLPVAAAADYGRVAPAVLAFKERGVRALHGYLAGLLADAVTASGVPDPVLVPIPASAGARRRRGADLLAGLTSSAAGRMGVPWVPGLSWARRHRTQKSLTRTQRCANMRAALRVRPAVIPPDRQVVLVDDVLTTGATLRAASAALQSGGFPAAAGAVVCASRSHPTR